MTDTTPGGWHDAARPGYPAKPERDGEHMIEWTDEHGRVWREVWKWRADSKPAVWQRPNFTGGPYGYEPKHLTAPIYAGLRYLGPCHTPAEVAAREQAAVTAYANALDIPALVEAARREEREACEAVVSHRAKMARNMQETARGKEEAAYWQNRASALELGAAAILARGDA